MQFLPVWLWLSVFHKTIYEWSNLWRMANTGEKRGVSNHSFLCILTVPGISTRAQICKLFKSFFVNKLLTIGGVHTGEHPFLYISEPCQVLPGPTAPLYIHKGAVSWELRAANFHRWAASWTSTPLSNFMWAAAAVKFPTVSNYVSCKVSRSSQNLIFL